MEINQANVIIDDIAANKLVAEAIEDNILSEHTFSNSEYIKHWDNIYTFKNVQIGNFIFKDLYIRIIPDAIIINLFSDNIVFYEESISFFGTNGITHRKEPYIIDNKEVQEYRRKLGRFEMLKKSVSVSVLKSEAYGCVIKLTIIN